MGEWENGREGERERGRKGERDRNRWLSRVSLGHIPIIDPNSRSGERRELAPAQKRRLDERSTAERGFSLLKEGFGARNIRVRGDAKVYAHLMFGLLALAADRLLNLAT